MKFVHKKSVQKNSLLKGAASCPFAHLQVCVCNMEVGSLLREAACAAACCTTMGRFLKGGVKERVRG